MPQREYSVLNDEISNLLGRSPRVTDEDDDKKPFGQLGANSSGSVMLDLRFKTGDRRALPYSYLGELDLDKSGKIILQFAGHKVTVVGRRLDHLYAGLVEQRVRFIREGTIGQEKDGEAFIESIRVERAD